MTDAQKKLIEHCEGQLRVSDEALGHALKSGASSGEFQANLSMAASMNALARLILEGFKESTQ